jgi:hypothetical protein
VLSKMIEQRLISSMFSRINREKQSTNVTKYLQVLEGTLRMDRAKAYINPPKRLVGRPKKSKET